MACHPEAHSRPLRSQRGREAGSSRAAFHVPARVSGGAGESARRRVSAGQRTVLPSHGSLDREAQRLGPLAFPRKSVQSLGASKA